MNATTQDFTPALGHKALTPLYDAAIALLTREGRWRKALLAQIEPRDGETIIDVGCGTGSLALMLKRAAPGARVVGIDPDAEVLQRAADKAHGAGVAIEFLHGYARDTDGLLTAPADKLVSSLVFHQVPMSEKLAGLTAMRRALRTDGELHVADYGLQRTALMRALFSQIQALDGRENTTPNARGALIDLMRQAGFDAAAETRVIPTPTGSISFYFARNRVPS